MQYAINYTGILNYTTSTTADELYFMHGPGEVIDNV